jgi:hypothetical protein
MRKEREFDAEIAQRVFGHAVRTLRGAALEDTPNGERPLAHYSRDIDAAWEVAERMNISLIPVEGGQWFAMVGQPERWPGPADFILYLQEGNFVNSGAAVDPSAPLAICIAALKALEQRQLVNLSTPVSLVPN